jgi:hypothetical protein
VIAADDQRGHRLAAQTEPASAKRGGTSSERVLQRPREPLELRLLKLRREVLHHRIAREQRFVERGSVLRMEVRPNLSTPILDRP